MVLVKAKRDDLLGPLSAVSGIIERRHTLPILSNVLIECGVGALSFLATDIEIQITSRGTLESSGEARSVTVGARKLVDILRALPESAEVTLQQQDKRLLVKAGKSRPAWPSRPAMWRGSRSNKRSCGGCSAWCSIRWHNRISAITSMAC